MAIFPFVFLREMKFKDDQTLVNHERIHFRQQIEMLIIFFYPVYLLNFILNLIRYGKWNKAYREIIFEREAYSKESDLIYLSKRKFWNFLNYCTGAFYPSIIPTMVAVNNEAIAPPIIALKPSWDSVDRLFGAMEPIPPI